MVSALENKLLRFYSFIINIIITDSFLFILKASISAPWGLDYGFNE